MGPVILHIVQYLINETLIFLNLYANIFFVKELEMSIETINNWPLATVCFPKGNIPQKESISHLSLSNNQGPTIKKNDIDAEPHNIWEKGTFIDLYI